MKYVLERETSPIREKFKVKFFAGKDKYKVAEVAETIDEKQEVDLYYRNPYYLPNTKEMKARIGKLSLNYTPNLEELSILVDMPVKVHQEAKKFENDKRRIYTYGLAQLYLLFGFLIMMGYSTISSIMMDGYNAVAIQTTIGLLLLLSMAGVIRSIMIADAIDTYRNFYDNLYVFNKWWQRIEYRTREGEDEKHMAIVQRYNEVGMPNLKDRKQILKHFSYFDLEAVRDFAKNKFYMWAMSFVFAVYAFITAAIHSDKAFMGLEHLIGTPTTLCFQISSFLVCMIAVNTYYYSKHVENTLKANEDMLDELDRIDRD